MSALVLLGLVAMACGGGSDDGQAQPIGDTTAMPELAPALEALEPLGEDHPLRQRLLEVAVATAPFQDVEMAIEAGYELADAGCFPGAGIHYLRADLIDGEIDELTPEAITYENSENGLRLVSVEYAVPYGLADAQRDVMGVAFEGPFYIADFGYSISAIHVWLWKPNPAGMFGGLNNTITC